MKPAIYELARKQRLDPGSIDTFIQAHTFPIVEDSFVTFVYRGEADAVVLEHWVYGLPPAQPFTRMGDSNLWFLIQEVPERSRIEYRFTVVRRGKRELLVDPLNPNRAESPAGPCSVLHAKGYQVPDWTQPDPEAIRGAMEEISLPSQASGEERRVSIYVPARFRKTRRYPLLMVHDGLDFIKYGMMQIVLDNLIDRLEIAPMIVALCYPPDRAGEHGYDPHQARFVVDELVPALERRYPLDARPSARGLMGASYGAVAALAVAWRHPGLFDRLLLQSCSFAPAKQERFERHTAVDPVVEFASAFGETPARPAERIFLSCGAYESRLHENRSLMTLLEAAGAEVRYEEPRDGHNWGNWRDRLRDGLSWLFPGPLWMIYE